MKEPMYFILMVFLLLLLTPMFYVVEILAMYLDHIKAVGF